MKLVLLVVASAALFTSQLAGASGFGRWFVFATHIDRVIGAEGFSPLQQQYPALFASFDASKVYRAELTIQELRYQGDSTCPTGDPRLSAKTYNYEVCVNNSNGTTSCTTQSQNQPSSWDPCE